MAPLIARLKHGVAGLRAPQPGGAWRALLPMLLLAAVCSLALVFYLWRDDASYRPLFGAQEKVAAADMMALLDAEQLRYRIHPQTGQLLVPEAELGRVRMLLAAKGVVAQLPAGLELLDSNDPLGVSQFVQDVRFRRGLEGELVQSITALEPVQGARVHLSLPRATSFVGAPDDKASASVVVTLKPGRSLSREQAAAIVRLVAGSVSVLTPARVTLVDQAGTLLSARLPGEDGEPVAGDEADAARRYRDQALANIDALLAPVLGAANYRASVSADINNDRVEETREQYGEAPKITNEASRSEQSSQRQALGVPGSLSNRPIPVESSAPQAEAGGNSKNAVSRQYAYDRNVLQIKRARGTLSRLSVAIVLNQGAAPGGGGWTPQQLADIEKLLGRGLGLQPARGDALALSVLRFPAAAVAEPWWGERDTWYDAAGALAWLLGGLLAYWLLARPLLAALRQWSARQAAPVAAPPALADADVDGDYLPAPAGAVVGRNALVPLLENYDLPPAGSSVDVLVEHLKGLAAKEPERVAEVVKQWVQKDGRTQ